MKVSMTAPRGKSVTQAVRRLVLTAETPEEEQALAQYASGRDADDDGPRPGSQK